MHITDFSKHKCAHDLVFWNISIIASTCQLFSSGYSIAKHFTYNLLPEEKLSQSCPTNLASASLHPYQLGSLRENEHKGFVSMTVVLNEGQGHSNWYQTVEISGLYHHSKFERS